MDRRIRDVEDSGATTQGVKVTFSGDKITVRQRLQDRDRFKLNASKKPKQMDKRSEEFIMARMLIVLSPLALFLPTLRAGDAKKDQEKIQGAWRFVQYVERGTASAKDELDFMEVVFKGANFEIKHPGGAGKKGTFKLDPKKKPAHIDLYGGDEKKPAMGIYVFDGKSLKICMPSGPDIAKGMRPTGFTSTRENANVLMVLEARRLQ